MIKTCPYEAKQSVWMDVQNNYETVLVIEFLNIVIYLKFSACHM